MCAILNMRHQWMLHRLAGFERGQNRVSVHWRALENLVAERIRKRVQNRRAPSGNWRLADAARANRRFRVGNIERTPLHVDRNVENGRRLVLVEALRNHLAVMRIEYPLLTDGVANAQC